MPTAADHAAASQAVASQAVADPALLAGLAAAAALPRSEFVARIRELRNAGLAVIKTDQLAHLGELTGLDVSERITALTDAVVVALAQRAASKAGAPDGWTEQVGIIALGGYGRREMSPYSDLDLLVLADDRPVTGASRPAWLEPMWAELNTLLWDVKFQVGASQRGCSELVKIIDEDFVTATALIEQRPLLAGSALAAKVAQILERFRSRRAAAFLRFKLDELGRRRSQAGQSIFLMEPNLKSNPGCLRDVQLLRVMAFAACGARHLPALAELESITRDDLAGVEATNDHLLRLRALLHFQHGRKQDVFQLADQVLVAKQLGYADVSRLRAVEHFMKAHYARTLHVHQILDLAISRLRAKGLLGRRILIIKSRKILDKDFTAVEGKLYLSHAGFFAQADPVLRLFQAARACQQRDWRFSYELQRQIRSHLHLVDDAARRDPRIAAVFLAMLGDLGRTRLPLEDLHHAGLLGAWLPEFGVLTCHMQFDSYHQYTVDEHSLIALGNLDAMAKGSVAPGPGRILPSVARKDLLALALLLHDMGKYMGRGHVARGALMVQAVAERLGLDQVAEDLVYFLVDRHVALSDASRMRNFHEPAFLKSFAERVGSRERLDALYCLTWCDARAVGEGVLTGWQEELLHELHRATADQLEHGGVRSEDHRQRLLRALTEGGTAPTAAAAFLNDLPHTYLHLARPDEVLRHRTVLAGCATDGLGLAWNLGDRGISVVVAAPDRHGLFADIAACLSGHGFDVIEARIWIIKSGAVLFSFRLASIITGRLGEAEIWDRLRRDLRAVSRNELDARALLDRRRRTIVVGKPADSGFDDPAVKIEHQSSDHWSVVDVHCKDEPGLLSRLCRAISDAGCAIGHACINTMGDVAVDVFYVQQHGAKLTPEAGERLRQQLIGALGLSGE